MYKPKTIALTIIFSISSVFILYSSYLLYKSISARNLPVTKAEIIDSKLLGGYMHSYTAHIKYKYTVNEKKFTNNRIEADLGIPTFVIESDGKNFIEDYSKGKEVDVYYDPTNPEISYLTATPSFGTFIALIIGLGHLYVGLSISKQDKI